MKGRLPIALAIAFAIATIVVSDHPTVLKPPPPVAVAPGYLAFVDPDTGEFVDGDPGSIPFSEELLGAVSSSDAGLVEEPGSVSGVTVRLEGRFASMHAAVADENGRLVLKCLSGLPIRAGGDQR